MKRIKKGYVIAALSVMLVLLVAFMGFSKHQTTIDSYSTEFNTFVLAKYSRTDTGVDFEGNFYSETDYWEEQVSEKWSVLTVDGLLISYNCPTDFINNNVCRTPEITIDHPKGLDFDNYSKVRVLKYYVDYGDGDFSSVDKEGYEISITKIGTEVNVKTWYGNAYGFEY